MLVNFGSLGVLKINVVFIESVIIIINKLKVGYNLVIILLIGNNVVKR